MQLACCTQSWLASGNWEVAVRSRIKTHMVKLYLPAMTIWVFSLKARSQMPHELQSKKQKNSDQCYCSFEVSLRSGFTIVVLLSAQMGFRTKHSRPARQSIDAVNWKWVMCQRTACSLGRKRKHSTGMWVKSQLCCLSGPSDRQNIHLYTAQ